MADETHISKCAQNTHTHTHTQNYQEGLTSIGTLLKKNCKPKNIALFRQLFCGMYKTVMQNLHSTSDDDNT